VEPPLKELATGTRTLWTISNILSISGLAAAPMVLVVLD